MSEYDKMALRNSREENNRLIRESHELLTRAEKAERERDEARASGRLLVEANTLHFDRAEKAESERDELRSFLEDITEQHNDLNDAALKRDAEIDDLRGLIARAVESIEPFEKAYERMTPDQRSREHTHFLGITSDFRRLTALATDLRRAGEGA
jgi:chromosome segregation ATPase